MKKLNLQKAVTGRTISGSINTLILICQISDCEYVPRY